NGGARGELRKDPGEARPQRLHPAWSSPRRVRQLMGEEAEELLKHRFAIINLWRPIRGPVLESPLTLCDAQSLTEEDLVASDLRYPDLLPAGGVTGGLVAPAKAGAQVRR